jgi:DNA-binding CsgD family transcriptional regulator/tetratricopeptide (TPR) repeat protein
MLLAELIMTGGDDLATPDIDEALPGEEGRPAVVHESAAGVALVGRAAELRLLDEHGSRVRAGEGGAVWVGGDPGIGKSALLRQMVGGARGQGCQVYSASAVEQSPVFPLQVLLEALWEDASGPPVVAREADLDQVKASRAEIVSLLGGGRAELVTPRDTVAVVAERLVTLVHRLCAISPAILVVDDVQWADAASLGVLVSLSRALRQLPLLLVIAGRSVPARPEVEALRAAMADAGALPIELGPVSPPEAAEIVRQVIGVPPGPALAAQLTAAGGNPLYLRELIDALARESRLDTDGDKAELRGGSPDLPATLSAAIDLRLGFLSESAMSALRVAAVLGPTFSIADLGIVTGRGASDRIGLDEALRAGVLAESAPGALAFRHGLVHQTLYQGMPASLRAALHGQAAENLAKAGAQPERVAVQLLAAPAATDSWVIDWIAEAAPVLSRRSPQVAAELLERARDRLGWQDPRREHLDADLAMARLMLGDNEQVLRLARPVFEYARDPTMAGRVAWTLAYALPRLGQHEKAIEVTSQALARDGLPLAWSARLRARQATSLFALGRFDEARAEAERAEAEGTQAGDRLAVGHALYTLARLDIIRLGTINAGRDAMHRALAVLGDEPQATDLVLQLMVNLGLIAHGLGLLAEADHMFAQAAALVERGTPPRQAYVRSFLAVEAFQRGRWDDALAELAAAAQLRLNTTHQVYVGGIGAQVALHRDDREATDAYLRDLPDIQHISGDIRVDVEYLVVAWAFTAEREGNPGEALTRLLAIFDPGGTLTFPRLSMIAAQWLPDVARLALAVGNPAAAVAAAQASTRTAQAQTAPPWTAIAQHCQGILDHDPIAVTDAAELQDAIGYPLFSAQALENAAVLHAERGDTKAARTAYLRAVEIYNGLGAAWDIRRADTRLRRHNIRRGTRGTRSRPASGWEALTPTEQTIAHLVASGQSNPDIASQLFSSRYTIDSHVSHILVKLNARSRFEIARAIAGRGEHHAVIAGNHQVSTAQTTWP